LVSAAVEPAAVGDLGLEMRTQLAQLARGYDLAKAINYILKRWAAYTLFLRDGRVCLSSNAAERIGGVPLGRKSWLSCGSDRDGQRTAAMYSLIATAKTLESTTSSSWSKCTKKTPRRSRDEIAKMKPGTYAGWTRRRMRSDTT
jgi:hypothetical protein